MAIDETTPEFEACTCTLHELKPEPKKVDDCPRCHRVFRVTEEQCSGCGFDPVNNEEDALEYDAYKAR